MRGSSCPSSHLSRASEGASSRGLKLEPPPHEGLLGPWASVWERVLQMCLTFTPLEEN